MSKSQGLSDYELPKLLSISSLKGHELGVDFNFDKQKNNKSPPLICQGMEWRVLIFWNLALRLEIRY